MKIVVVLFGYIIWHYSKALRSLFDIWRNFLTFVIDFFSIRQLIKNLFDPWKRMSDPYPKSFNLQAYFFAFLTNMITRAVGLLMRLGLLLVGLVALFLFLISLPLLFILWLVLPVLVILLIGQGLYLIFT